MKLFTVIGIWWFPHESKLQFDAKLEFTAQGINLIPTSDRFKNLYMEKYGKRYGTSLIVDVGGSTYKEPLLMGFAEGKQYTLLNCVLYASGVSIGLIVEGTHFNKSSEVSFPAYSLSFSGLDEWGFSEKLNGYIQENEDGSRYFHLTYEMPAFLDELQKIELKDVYIEISHSITLSKVPIRNEGALIERTNLRILPKTGLSVSAIDVIEIYSNLLRNFLMLATWNYVKPLYVRAWSDPNDVNKQQVELYWHGKGIGLATPEYKNDWLFTMMDLGDSLEAILQSWESNWHIFSPFIRNYFAHRYISENFIEVKFLAYMQALSAFAKKAGYDKQLLGLLNSINSKSQYEVLKQIVDHDIEGFVTLVVDIRNDLTHEVKLDISATKLAQYTQKLELIIVLSVYHILGFQRDFVQKISATNNGFQKRM